MLQHAPASLTPEHLDMAKLVRPGDTVMWTQGAGEPVSIINRLMAQREEIGRFSVFMGGSTSGAVRPEHGDLVHVTGLGGVGSNRELCAAGLMDIYPCHLSELPKLLSSGTLKVDVVIMQISRPDRQGVHSHGATNGYVQYALDHARVKMAEVNNRAPWTYSTEQIDVGRFDYVVHTDCELAASSPAKPGPVDAAVASNISRFIDDGSILQVGIGTIPNALLAALNGRRRLGLHAGVVGDAAIKLIEDGIVDNSTKTLNAGKTVAGALLGTRQLFDFADRNPDILIEAVSRTHDHAVLSTLKNFVCVNSAIEVDLTGQVGSEIAGNTYLGTIGGQVDFVRGALASEGGRSIIGLPSRSKTTSRIVARLKSGVVTSLRSDADVIVTEYGSAELRGKSIPERVKRMISIAHPGDRDALEREAKEFVVGY